MFSRCGQVIFHHILNNNSVSQNHYFKISDVKFLIYSLLILKTKLYNITKAYQQLLRIILQKVKNQIVEAKTLHSAWSRSLWFFSIKQCLSSIFKFLTAAEKQYYHCYFTSRSCFTQTNNHNRFVRLKFHYIFTILKIHILLSTSLC